MFVGRLRNAGDPLKAVRSDQCSECRIVNDAAGGSNIPLSSGHSTVECRPVGGGGDASFEDAVGPAAGRWLVQGRELPMLPSPFPLSH